MHYDKCMIVIRNNVLNMLRAALQKLFSAVDWWFKNDLAGDSREKNNRFLEERNKKEDG